MRKIFLVLTFLLCCHMAYSQNSGEILTQAAKAYGLDTSTDGKASGFMGFSWAGIIAGLIFSGIGFVAFSYGKKNAEYVPMGIGMALMVYPYFVQNTLALYLIGIALTVGLYFFR